MPGRQGWYAAISNTVTGLNYELIEIERAQRGLLRVTIDRVPGKIYAVDAVPAVLTTQAAALPHGNIAEGETEAAVGSAAHASGFITVEDCEKVTRQLQYVLEVEGLDYARLEVSSPGLDRLLRHEADFRRFSGELVDIVLKVAFQKRKSWRGVLQAAAADAAAGAASTPGPSWQLVIKEGTTEQVFAFSMDEVREARLHPVVNFKGRGSGKASGADEGAGRIAGAESRSVRQQPGVAHGSVEAQDAPPPDGG